MSRSSMRRSELRKKQLQRRPLGLESLERRSVLCAVVCSLDDGMLTVSVGEGEDTISVQVNDQTKNVEVRHDGQLVQSYVANSVQNVEVHSSHGSMPLPAERVQIDPALTSSSTTSTGMTAPPVANVPPVASVATPAVIAQDTQSQAAAVFAAATVVAPSTFQNSASYSAVANQEDHGTHASSLSASPNSLAGVVSSPSSEGHDHNNTTATSIATPTSTDSGTPGSAVSARTLTRESGGEGHHLTFSKKQNANYELAPKFCTTTPYAKQLITNVYGKAECSCVDKQKDKGGDLFDFLGDGRDARLLVDATGQGRDARSCRPNQSDFQLGLMTEWEVCAERSVDEVIKEITGEVDPATRAEQQLVPDQTSVESRAAAAAIAFASDSWTDSMRQFGWALVAAGVALIPAMLVRESEEDEEESNWSRGGFELLAN